jgi:O-antigen ligase/tetratricopeptide (TPR) repeat protein
MPPVQEPSRPPRNVQSSTALALTALLLLLLPLSRGAVDQAVQLGALLVASASAVLATWSSREVPWPALLLAIVVCIIGLQLVPIPPVLHGLSPATRSLFERSLAPIGAYPAARPFSLDVPGTAAELGKAVTCLGAFVSAASVAGTRQRRGRLVEALAAASAIVALAVLGAATLGLQPILAPHFPFVNPNHLAGFLDFGAFVTLGLAVRVHGQQRLLWGLAFIGVTVVLFASLSRGGIAAYFVGLAIFSALYLWKRKEMPARRRIAVAAAASAAGVGAACFLALGSLERELQTIHGVDQEAKVAQWPAGARMIRDFALTGIGRGAFATTFPAYKTDDTDLTFTHLENEWLQVFIDLGVPGGLLLVGTLVAVGLIALRRPDVSTAELGIIAGAGALAAHEIFDFSLELLGVGVPLSVAMGLLTRGSRVVHLPRALWSIAAAALVLAGVVGAGVGRLEGGDRAGERVAQAPLESVAAAAVEEASWRPADYLPHAAAGARFVAARRCQEALPWLLRAMALAPGVPEPHLDLARCLGGRSASIARREYLLAYQFGRPEALREAAKRWPLLDDLLEAVPGTPDALLALGGLLMDERRPSDARRVYAQVLEQFGDERALGPLALATLNTGELEGTLELARRMVLQEATAEEGHRLAALCLLQLGREEEAELELERGIVAVPGSPPLLQLLAERRIGQRRFSEARRLAEQMTVRTPSEIAAREQLAARTLAAQGRLGEAIERASSACGALPDSPEPPLLLARLAIEAGRIADAEAALGRAAALSGSAPDVYAARVEELRAKLAGHAKRDEAPVRSEGMLLPEGR